MPVPAYFVPRVIGPFILGVGWTAVSLFLLVVMTLAAAKSRFGRLRPTMVMSFRFGSRSMSVRGNAIRSRRVHTTSKGRSASTASASER